MYYLYVIGTWTDWRMRPAKTTDAKIAVVVTFILY